MIGDRKVILAEVPLDTEITEGEAMMTRPGVYWRVKGITTRDETLLLTLQAFDGHMLEQDELVLDLTPLREVPL